jgi:hypothetical protein
MMGKTRIFAKPNLTQIRVQPTALVLAKRFAQPEQLFSRKPVTVSLEWSIDIAMAAVVAYPYAPAS